MEIFTGGRRRAKMRAFPGGSGVTGILRASISLVLVLSTVPIGGTPAIASSGASAASVASPDSAMEQGPFEERNQFPFNLIFLQFPARGGSTLPRGEHRVLLSQTYSSIFVGSDIFSGDFAPLSDSRQRLTAPILAAAQAARPGQSLFLVDTEQGRTEIRWRAGITRRIEVGVEVPFLSYRGGSFDGFIEGYHRTFGLADGGRELYVRNLTEIALTLEGDSYFTGQTPDLYQLSDVSLFGRFQVVRSASLVVALSAGVKLPTGDPDRLGGSGGTDCGLEMEGTRRWGRHRLHFGAGWVRTDRWSLFSRFRPADTGNLLAAYEFVQHRRLSWIAQVQSQSTVFRGARGADPDLSRPSTEFLGGVKWSGRDDRWSFETAFIENLFNQNNGVDIGLRAGVAFRPAPR